MNSLSIPFVKSDRAVFGVLFLAGFAACSMFGVSQAATRGWLHPLSILGYMLGALAMLLGVGVLFRTRLGPIQNDRTALKALLGIIVAKVLVSLFYGLI